MSAYLRTRAVVLRHEQPRNADVRILFLSAAHGKVDAIARGLHLQKSKLASSLQPFTVIEASFVQGRQRRIVTGSIPERLQVIIRQDPARAFAAGLIVRLADLMLPIEQPDTATFELTVDALAALDRPKVTPQGLSILPYAYAWKLFSRVGYLPDLATCRVCGKVFGTGSLFLDARGGGIIHQTCAANDFPALSVNGSIIRALLLLTQAPLAEAVGARMSASLEDAIIAVTRSLMEERYDVPIRGPFWTTLSSAQVPVHEA